MTKIDIDKRTYRFALDILRLVKGLPRDAAGFVLGRQILRSGTSVAANIEEAQSACSKDDFIYKVGISLKEARETNLWLRLLKDGDVVDKKESLEAIIKESEEVMNILASIIKSAKAKNK